MSTAIRVTPPNSVLLVMDVSGGEVPRTLEGALIASTHSCIAIGCKAEVDGETEITLTRGSAIPPTDCLAFEGELETPGRWIVVRSVLGEVLLETRVLSTKTWIRVWLNDSVEPDKVIVAVD